MELLTAYIPMDRRQALAQGRDLPDRCHGAALFVDISGFTPLTQALVQELGPQHGVEELARQLNHVYEALIAQVHRYGGSVIGFSGDAFTCWLEGDPGRRATACALALQGVMGQHAEVTTPAGTALPLAIKVAVTAGPARRFLVGEPGIQRLEALAGTTLDRMATAEELAEAGEVVVGAEVVQHLGAQSVVQTWRPDAAGERFAIIRELTEPAAPRPWPDAPPVSAEVGQAWLLPPVYERLRSGQEPFLAELRPAQALMMQFSGIDYEADDWAGDKLDAYIRWAQQILGRYAGYLIELTIGDKGSYVYAVFGAPVAQADDAARAVAAAWALREVPAELDGIDKIRMGLAQGPMRVGAYGGPSRRSYGVLGGNTSLAARLMEKAGAGGILCDYETYRQARGRWAFEALPPVRVKGYAGLVRVYRPTGEVVTRGALEESPQPALVGRQAELARLDAALDAVEAGEPRVLIIEGAAGIGKSRLVAELARRMRERGLTGLLGAGRSIAQQTAYRAWRDIFASYFDLDEVSDLAERQTRVRNVVEELAPDQLQRLPLLNDVLNLNLPETELTASLDAELRQQSLVSLLLTLLRAWTRERPLTLVLEDAHWLDSLSWELAVQVARSLSLSGEPLLLVVVTRPLEEHTPEAGHLGTLQSAADAEALSLTALKPDETVTLVADRLGVGADTLPAEVVNLVLERSGGNPFFAEELVSTLHEAGWVRVERGRDGHNGHAQCVVGDDFGEAHQVLPDTLRDVIQARLDQLPPEIQTVLKVASVIGPTFTYRPLLHVLNRHMPISEVMLRWVLQDLASRDFTRLAAMAPEVSYQFKHVITQEVIYQTLLSDQRRQLHRTVAEWYEAVFSRNSELQAHIETLAHHYYHSVVSPTSGNQPVPAEEVPLDQLRKATDYLTRAGDRARGLYTHQTAIDFYQQALALLKDRDRHERAARLMMKLGLTYHNAFEFRRARQAYDEGFALWQRAGAMQPVNPPPAPHALRRDWWNPSTLDPTIANDRFSAGVIHNLFSGLVELTPDLGVVPDVARAWEVSEGGRRYVFHLRDDVRWSDGAPVTAGDFEYAWKRALDPATKALPASLMYDVKGARAFHQGEVTDPDTVAVRASDEVTLVVELEKPTGYFLQLLAYPPTYPVPRHVMEAHSEAWTELGNIVTNGPFRLEAWDRGESMVLVRNHQYYGPFTGNVQQVELSLHEDPSTLAQLEMYEADDMDIVGLEPEMVRARQRHAREYVSGPRLATWYVGFTVSRPPFDDPRVRQAFVLAIDRETLVDVVMRGYFFPATGGFVPPGMPGHSARIGLPYDPDQARQLLVEAGYPGGRCFPVVELLTSVGGASGSALYGYLQAQWQEVLGIDITWETIELAMYDDRLDREPPHMHHMGWAADYPDPDNFLRVCPVRRWTGWRHRVYDRLVEDARRVMDQEERMKLYRQADMILVEDAAIMPLDYGRLHMLIKPWVTKYPISSTKELYLKESIIKPH